MNALARALSAETLKLRGTLALWLSLIAPTVVVALFVLQLTFSNMGDGPPDPPDEAWFMFAQGTLIVWTFLMLPLFVTLESALLAGLEHANHQWRHLLALPVPRGVHYLAKQFVLIGLVALAMAVLLVLIALGGWLLGHLQPRLGIAGPPPWELLLPRIGGVFAAALLIIALHTWLAIRWRSFTVAVSIGMVATVAGYLIGQSDRFGPLYPWSMPAQVLADKGERFEFVVIASVLGAVVVTLIGFVDFLRREVE